MKLSERVAIITEENISRLSRFYGEIDINALSRIVNNHLKVVLTMQKVNILILGLNKLQNANIGFLLYFWTERNRI